MTPSESIIKLAPFLLRSRSLEVGRDRLLQVRNKLLFILATEDLSDNSLKKMLLQFNCPVVQCFSSSDIEKLFKLYGTKIIGFRRSSLCTAVLKELTPCRLHYRGNGVLPPIPLPDRPRVAVLGVGGIGAHHAFWWNYEGAEVTAFLCSSPEHISEYATGLSRRFAFQGTGYTAVDRLLEQEKPDIVDVCLPDPLHYTAVRQALEAGCHVLCEKPFVYDEKMSSEALLAQAEELTALAAARRSLLGISSQYAVAIRKCLNLRADQSRDPDYFDGLLVSPGRAGAADVSASWYDMGTHYLAAAQICARPGRLTPDNFRFSFTDHSVTAEFACSRPDTPRLFRGRITTRYQQNPPESIRKIRLDQETFLLEGRQAQNGLFQMNICCGDRKIPCEDTLQLLIRSFLKNRLEFPAEMAVENLAMLLAIREKQS